MREFSVKFSDALQIFRDLQKKTLKVRQIEQKSMKPPQPPSFELLWLGAASGSPSTPPRWQDRDPGWAGG